MFISAFIGGIMLSFASHGADMKTRPEAPRLSRKERREQERKQKKQKGKVNLTSPQG